MAIMKIWKTIISNDNSNDEIMKDENEIIVKIMIMMKIIIIMT